MECGDIDAAYRVQRGTEEKGGSSRRRRQAAR